MWRFPAWTLSRTPRSLQGQMLLAIALALLVAQGLSAGLIWREQNERRVQLTVNEAAFRLIGQPPRDSHGPDGRPHGPPPPDDIWRLPRPLRVRVDAQSPAQAGDRQRDDVAGALHDVLDTQGLVHRQVLVVERDPRTDAIVGPWFGNVSKRLESYGDHHPDARLIIASIQRPDGTWLTARILAPANERQVILSLLMQTVLLYLVLVGAVALILRRIARPLKALTGRVEAFARERSADGQLEPEGPDDIRRLIVAHNAMEGRIIALLDEKDVMLGAIGHDLKTPLAALRVRIEAVEDDTERARMAATIEDINRSLDDILSLARVGRPSDPLETTELSALVADVMGEYEDMGEDVTLEDTVRIVLPLRATWLRRAMRNLVSNALRYGQRARVSLAREGAEAVLRIEDDGPGIPEGDILRMMEPFTRLEASRNTATGGTGLGLTLARAIADQHGGSLVLANRWEAGRITGLTATLCLPLAA
ncbi:MULTISPECIES: ATP-binding protein [unclassified Novosphingobium]|uniref:sensor histidine kinase n=1 Tax=unclassified Novosphingobium TaxID=2644732 RepID=UPI0017F67EF1|nr:MULTISPECIES: ATP-binding protein [unclassified Novosphingobium]NMN07016.1 signal transduction histidine kinase [Novosphingobium sp. SG919]NMN89396.1 signal transduction histidine kinase [Novosphingobium sp. SG916]